MAKVRLALILLGLAILLYSILEAKSIFQLSEDFTSTEQAITGLVLIFGVIFGQFIGGVLILGSIFLAISAYFAEDSQGYIGAAIIMVLGGLFSGIGYRARETKTSGGKSWRSYSRLAEPMQNQRCSFDEWMDLKYNNRFMDDIK